jgi:acyl-CoA synthetase (NDP forming)
VFGRRCWQRIAELPETPDVALFCMGHERVFDAFAGAAERGVRAAVLYDGGFAEQGENGRRLQLQIAAICREAGIALCGPNCMGVLNPYHPSATYRKNCATRRALPAMSASSRQAAPSV